LGKISKKRLFKKAVAESFSRDEYVRTNPLRMKKNDTPMAPRGYRYERSTPAVAPPKHGSISARCGVCGKIFSLDA